MDKLQLGCQGSSGIGFGYGICDGLEVVVLVVGSGNDIGSSDSNIHTQLLLKFRTLRCTKRCKIYLFRNIVRHIISYALYIGNTAH